jgi:hypothetical protein
MAKHYSIGCVYRSGDVCTHVDRPHRRKPSGGVCAKVCKLYDGPPATCSVVDEPVVKFTDVTKPNAGGGCSGCGKGKPKPAPIKIDSAEAARILNDAINNPDKESKNGKEEAKAKSSVDEERGRHTP